MKRTLLIAGAVAAALTLSPSPVQAGQGTGSSILTVSTTVIAPDRITDLTITGTDYLVPPHATGVDVFGGVYVFFGWVADPARFGPSIRNSENNDGTFGVSYAYPGNGGDGDTRDDGSGTMRLVSFTPGGESGEATDFHMDDNGNWSTTLRIYGSTFTTTSLATGETTSYDCTVVQCGIFTIGAHGKASATNERFVPIAFDAAVGVGVPQVVEPTAAPTTPPPAPTAAPTTPVPTAAPTTAAAVTTTAPPSTSAAATTTTAFAASAAGPDTTTGPGGTVESVASTGSSPAVPIAIGVAVVAAVGGTTLWRRRRRTTTRPV